MRRGTYVWLGLRSLRRLGVTAFVLLIIGGYLVDVGIVGLQQIADEKSKKCAVIATGADISAEQIVAVRELEGVTKFTPVIVIPTTLVVNENSRELILYAIYPDWISGEITGTIFPDTSTMPFVLLREKTLQGFTDKNGKQVFSDSIDWQSGETTVYGQVGKICGLVAEESNESAGYISHSAAEAMLRFAGQAPSYSQIWIELENSGFEQPIAESLTKLGLTPSAQDTSKWQRWSTETENSKLRIFSGIAVLFGAAAVIATKTKHDMSAHESEYRLLRYAGARQRDIWCIVASRVTIYVLLALIAAAAVASLAAAYNPK